MNKNPTPRFSSIMIAFCFGKKSPSGGFFLLASQKVVKKNLPLGVLAKYPCNRESYDSPPNGSQVIVNVTTEHSFLHHQPSQTPTLTKCTSQLLPSVIKRENSLTPQTSQLLYPRYTLQVANSTIKPLANQH